MTPLSVITVTHNHARYLRACLASVTREAAQVGAEVIVVDNRSDDDSERIARSFPEVRVLTPPVRRGFSANNNLGMAHANGRYLLLLNPDTEVKPGAFAELIRFMDSHPRAGMCGARLRFPDGSVQPSARRFPKVASVIARRTPLRVLLKDSAANRRHLMQDVSLDAPTRVDWLLGACMFVRRELLDDVGPLDEGYFLYVEDIDWARRMTDKGWEVWYVPSAEIVHHHLAVSDRILLSRRSAIHAESMLRFVLKHSLPEALAPKSRFEVYRAELQSARHRPLNSP